VGQGCGDRGIAIGQNRKPFAVCTVYSVKRLIWIKIKALDLSRGNACNDLRRFHRTDID